MIVNRTLGMLFGSVCMLLRGAFDGQCISALAPSICILIDLTILDTASYPQPLQDLLQLSGLMNEVPRLFRCRDSYYGERREIFMTCTEPLYLHPTFQGTRKDSSNHKLDTPRGFVADCNHIQPVNRLPEFRELTQ